MLGAAEAEGEVAAAWWGYLLAALGGLAVGACVMLLQQRCFRRRMPTPMVSSAGLPPSKAVNKESLVEFVARDGLSPKRAVAAVEEQKASV